MALNIGYTRCPAGKAKTRHEKKGTYCYTCFAWALVACKHAANIRPCAFMRLSKLVARYWPDCLFMIQLYCRAFFLQSFTQLHKPIIIYLLVAYWVVPLCPIRLSLHPVKVFLAGQGAYSSFTCVALLYGSIYGG
jgi:hypothetical protein